MTRRNIFAAALILTLGLAGAANAKPNFSGDWKLNIDKSEFGPIPPPESMSMKIEHSDPKMKVATTQNGAQGEMNYEVNYTTDGKETTNTIGPMEAKSTVVWEGDNLVVNTKLEANGMEFTIKSVWMLAEDGKTMTQNAHITSSQGEADLKYIMEKQEK